MIAGWERRDVTVAGVKLSYLERGVAHARTPSLLMLHGLIATAETLQDLACSLDQTLHVVALDLPGNGGSERRRDLDATFRGLALMIREFWDKVGLHRPVLVGHSHGGALALQIAMLHPDACCGLVLLCPAHPFSGEERQIVSFYLSPVGRVVAHLIPFLPWRIQRIGFKGMVGHTAQISMERFARYGKNLRVPGTVGHVLRLLASWNADMGQLCEQMCVEPLPLPVLMIWGVKDPVVPASTAPALKRHLLKSQLLLLPGVGHLPNDEAPERCAEAIEAWLGELRRADPA